MAVTSAQEADAKMSADGKGMIDMDIEGSGFGYKQRLPDSSNIRYSVHVLRNSPYRLATVCFAVLCVVLVAVAIGQSVHYRKVEQEHQNNLQAMNKEKEILQQNLETLQKEKNDLETTRSQLRQNYDYLSKKKDQIQTNNDLLTRETANLKSQLQASKATFDSKIKQLQDSRDLLQTNNNALTTAKNLLQKQYDSVVKRRNELQASYDSVTKDRNNLQNKLNNVTRAKEHLQISYNTLIKDIEHLQDRFNFSSSEKDKLASSHHNLTIDRGILQAKYNLLVNATDELQVSYTSLLKEKQDLESNCNNVTVVRDLLKVKNGNLSAERDQLQKEVERLNATITAKTCPAGWKKFQYSCYFTSVAKKTWSQSREHCQSNGADLAIIESQEEMTFINGLYKSDKEVWIGLTDEGIEGHWKWVDGTPMTTAYWGKGQPNSFDGRNQDCVEFWHRVSGTGDWNDENCNVEQNWICEK
nr:CD209 antigen-like isoform X1 [Monopterus albus]